MGIVELTYNYIKLFSQTRFGLASSTGGNNRCCLTERSIVIENMDDEMEVISICPIG